MTAIKAVRIPDHYLPPLTDGQLRIRQRLAVQTKAAMNTGKVTCIGPHPEACDYRAHENHALELPLWKAVKCLYCGFWFCERCAGKHFGKTRAEYNAEREKQNKGKL